jgi:hypothetical protein
MVTVDDIVQHITQQLCVDSRFNPITALREFLASSLFDIHLCMTPDLEATELSYLQQFGQGYTFYFRIRDYEDGKRLAREFYHAIIGYYPDVEYGAESSIDTGRQLYLFINIQYVIPTSVLTDAFSNKPATLQTGCRSFNYHN